MLLKASYTVCVANMKFLCLTLCQGEVCTDDVTNADANNDDGQFMIVKGCLVDKPNEPKIDITTILNSPGKTKTFSELAQFDMTKYITLIV